MALWAVGALEGMEMLVSVSGRGARGEKRTYGVMFIALIRIQSVILLL